jgi:hypothetical protein
METVEKLLRHLLLILVLMAVWSCGTAQKDLKATSGFILTPDTRIVVADVSNDTGQVVDVDVIGLFWDALSEALRKQNLLWTKGSAGTPLKLEAHLLKYKKGNALERWLIPGFGKTLLAVRCDLKEGMQVLAAVEARRSISFGDGPLMGAWKKIFTSVAEETVEELRTGMGGSRIIGETR